MEPTGQQVSWIEQIHRDNIMNINTRHKHWSERSAPTRVLRQLGAAKARNLSRYETLRALVYVTYPDLRDHDAVNLYPTMKASIRGLLHPYLVYGTN